MGGKLCNGTEDCGAEQCHDNLNAVAQRIKNRLAEITNLMDEMIISPEAGWGIEAVPEEVVDQLGLSMNQIEGWVRHICSRVEDLRSRF